MVEIEIDGIKIEAEDGATIIEVADSVGITIPRFCYHPELSVAANCRMCLVEIEGGRKPMPACATPISQGMKVYTKSPAAIEAQRDVMRFLLINHPLDCPICDQGGECDLQDQAMGHGNAHSQFEENKRRVAEPDLGPLVYTGMTRCIQCTRCIRFGTEVAGLPELGATGRGENMKIGTYVKHYLQSEVSGNIIDICPVGALMSKPYKFTGRAWEMSEHPSVSPHDGWGSNVYIHSRTCEFKKTREIMRILPKNNDAINGCWLSDRDRFSYVALESEQRIYKPLMKQRDEWVEVTWQHALVELAKRMKNLIAQHGSSQLGAIISPSSTTEEAFVLQKMIRGLGSNNIDHRMHYQDFSQQKYMAEWLQSDIQLSDIGNVDRIFTIGTFARRELPLLGVRLRKAVLNGASVLSLHARQMTETYDVDQQWVYHPQQWLEIIAACVQAVVSQKGIELSTEQQTLLADVKVSEEIEYGMRQFLAGSNTLLVVGSACLQHPEAGELQLWLSWLQQLSGARRLVNSQGANALGMHTAGAVPYAKEHAGVIAEPGYNCSEMWKNSLKSYLLFGFEPEFDTALASEAMDALQQASLVACFNSFVTDTMKKYADFILPIAPFVSNAGSYINIYGDWQSFTMASIPLDEVKPGWKVLRVLANLLDLEEFEFDSATHLTEYLNKSASTVDSDHSKAKTFHQPKPLAMKNSVELYRLARWPLYRVDGMVRRSQPLQDCLPDSLDKVMLNAPTAAHYHMQQGEIITIIQQGDSVQAEVDIDQDLADHVVMLASGTELTQGFGSGMGPISINKEV